jgi:hypothetical protein
MTSSNLRKDVSSRHVAFTGVCELWTMLGRRIGFTTKILLQDSPLQNFDCKLQMDTAWDTMPNLYQCYKKFGF